MVKKIISSPRMCVDGVPFRERGRPCYYIFSAFKYDEQNRRWHPCVRLDSSKVPSSTINDLSPCLPRRWSPSLVFVARWNGHASSGAQKATFATPTCRYKHVATDTFEHWGYRGNQRVGCPRWPDVRPSDDSFNSHFLFLRQPGL